jgi:hypothetical protein
MKMIKSISLFILITISLLKPLKAQEISDSSNVVKLNLSALLTRNFSVQYERKVSPKVAVALGIHFLPFGKLPYQNIVSDIADVNNIDFTRANIGSFGIVPEVRFYPGNKGALRGFYFGPFISYSRYKTDLPINYSNKTGVFNGDISTITGGLQIGFQNKLSKKVYLDIWIIGPNYGGSSGNLIFEGKLDEVEQSALQFSIQDVKDNFPIKFIKSYNVNENGGDIKVKGPWAGLRGAGINLGFRF